MYILLLTIIYTAFICLGLPDSLLGSGWPSMQLQMGVPLSYAGMISMMIAGGTIISSLMSDRLTKRFGTGLVTAASVFMTTVALFGFSISNQFWMLCIFTVPYGLGAGAVDAALNNYVALRYTSRHMSWLHCFWGVGASISPNIMGYALSSGMGWNSGYQMVSIIQIILSALLFMTLPIWKKQKHIQSKTKQPSKSLKLTQAVRIHGVKYILIAFFAYCVVEATAGLWASSYLVLAKGLDSESAARFASFYYLGITIGRFISGLIANRIGDRNMIRIGIGILLSGIIIILLSFTAPLMSVVGLLVVGLGCAPIYPSIIHSTPHNFGAENSQAIVGIQMASAYTGATFVPPIFGLIANYIDIGLYPVFLLLFGGLLLYMTERLNKKLPKPRKTKE